METDLIADHGNGPAVAGTRITVYNLIPELFDPSRTEGQLCDAYDLTPGQVAAARAYVLNHYPAVMAEHRRIQDRFDAGNPPEVLDRIRDARERLKPFREWMAEKESAAGDPAGSAAVPAFREWLAAREQVPAAGGR